MIGESEENLQPFRESLTTDSTIPIEKMDRIRAFESNSEKIVRSMATLSGGETKSYSQLKLLYKELQEYGIKMPSFELVVGHDENIESANMYTIVDRVYGKNLTELSPEELKVIKNSLEALYSSLCHYLKDKYENGGGFIEDFKNSQLMYGKRKGEGEDSLYWVDLSPFYSQVSKENRASAGNKYLFENISDLWTMIKQTETKLDAPLERARQSLRSLLTSIPQNDRNYLTIEKLLEEQQ